MSNLVKSPRIVSSIIALAIALALGIVTGNAMQAYAAQGDMSFATGSVAVQTQAAKPKLITETVWLGSDSYGTAIIANMPRKAKITKAISAKPGVLKVKLDKSYNYVRLLPKKTGKSKVTIAYKVGGKTTKVSGTYAVKKFPSPLKSVALNGKKLQVPNSKHKQTYIQAYNFKGTSVKFKAVPAKGWKIINMGGDVSANNGKYWKSIKVKNGKKISVSKGKDVEIFMTLENKKGDRFSCTYAFSRSGMVILAGGTIFVGQGIPISYGSTFDGKLLTDVKYASSNPSVLQVDSPTIPPNAVKPGKSTVDVTYKYKGVKYSTSAAYTVKAYVNPFSSLAVNGKSIDLNANHFGYHVNGYKSTSAKVSAVVAKGWKITQAYYFNSANVHSSFKNGQSARIPKNGWASVQYDLKNAAGDTMTYSVTFSAS